MSRQSRAVLCGAALGALAACAPPGLPPAGPGPNEVDVGYGTQDEKTVTGAVTTVSNEDIGTARPQGLEELLRGRVPGLQISSGPGGRGLRLRIRGTNSLLADIDPLVIVDGVHISVADLSTVLAGYSSEDIRQVDVLKDVASTAIYGMRGAGGVIIITTRR